MIEADPSKYFIGGEFEKIASGMSWEEVSDVPEPFLPRDLATGQLHPLRMRIRHSLLTHYMLYVNRLLDEGNISRPIATLNKFGDDPGVIVNTGRGVRPIGEETSFAEGQTPPAILEIYDEKGQGIRIFFNAYPYVLPEVNVLEDTPFLRRETVPGLSLVASLDLQKPPIYDPHHSNAELLKVWFYALAKVTRLIKDEGEYLNREDGQFNKKFETVIAFGNISDGEDPDISGGSVKKAHFQVIAYPKGYAPSLYTGLDLDENGNCARTAKMKARVAAGVGGEVIDIKTIRRDDGTEENIVLYAPGTTASQKGDVIRIASDNQFPDWETGITDPTRIDHFAKLLHWQMWAMRPGSNVIWAQGEEGHAFVEVQTANRAGGYWLVRHVFEVPIGESGYSAVKRVRPNITYNDSAAIGENYIAQKSSIVFPLL